MEFDRFEGLKLVHLDVMFNCNLITKRRRPHYLSCTAPAQIIPLSAIICGPMV